MTKAPAVVRRNPWLDLAWWLLKLAGRFVSGRPLDGRRRTDSQFLHAGTHSLDGLRHPSRWSMLPGWRRAARRLEVTLALAGSAWAWAAGYGTALEATAASVAAGIAILVGFRIWRAARLHRHNREWVKPLHLALTRPLELTPVTSPQSYLDVPTDLHTNESAQVRIALPENFSGAEPGTRKIVEDIVTTKLAIPDAEFAWRVAGAAPVLVVRQAPQPPTRVIFDDLRDAMTAAASGAPVLGLGVRGRPESVDLDADSPHIGLSMAPGGGKSVTAKVIASQILNRGGLVVVLDLKRVSQMWARGIPGVAYCRDIAEIHDALIVLAAEGDRRFSLIEDQEEDTILDAPRIFVVVEELNATMKRLQRYWSEIKGKDDPKLSPAVQALGDGLFLGRQGLMHYMLIAQMLTANAAGGTEIRESLSTRILSRYSQNAARMLVPEMKLPPASRIVGRAQVYRGGEVHPTQIGFLTSAQAREWALAGQQSLGLELPTRASVAELVSAAAPTRVTQLHVVPTYGTAPALPAAPAADLVGLAAACREDGPLALAGVTLAAARKAVQRDPEFPEPAGVKGVEKLYRPAELERWTRNRPRAGASTSEAG